MKLYLIYFRINEMALRAPLIRQLIQSRTQSPQAFWSAGAKSLRTLGTRLQLTIKVLRTGQRSYQGEDGSSERVSEWICIAVLRSDNPFITLRVFTGWNVISSSKKKGKKNSSCVRVELMPYYSTVASFHHCATKNSDSWTRSNFVILT